MLSGDFEPFTAQNQGDLMVDIRANDVIINVQVNRAARRRGGSQ